MSGAAAFLPRIVEARRAAVARAQADLPLRDIARCAASASRDARPFAAALAGAPPGRLAVIAEVKRVSPARGDLRADLDPTELAARYARGGAAALSVLTEPDFFHARPEDLGRARAASGLPTLRKEFLVDPWQVYETAMMGADAVLLLVVVLGQRTAEFVGLCLDLGVEPFVEVHTEAELDIALATPARVIGINNRDLRSFEVDRATSRRLAPRAAAAGRTVAALSGISGPADTAGLYAAGVRAILVGESLVRAANPEAAVRALTSAGVPPARAVGAGPAVGRHGPADAGGGEADGEWRTDG